MEACCFVLVLEAPVFDEAVFMDDAVPPVFEEVGLEVEAMVLELGVVLPVDDVLLIDILLVDALLVDALPVLVDVLPAGAPAGAFVPVVFFAVVLGAVLWSVPEFVAAKAAHPVGSANTRMAAKVRTHPV